MDAKGDPRLYVVADLLEEQALPLSAAQCHYLLAVMRRKPGDHVRLFNGRDGEWSAVISDLKRAGAVVCPVNRLRVQSDEPALTLTFAALKRDACAMLVQKATEIGVTRLQPVLTERSQGLRLNAARMTAIAVEAAEQSERLVVPQVETACSLSDLLAVWPTDRPLAVALERSGAGFTPTRADALLIGPEGGFSRRELDALAAYAFVLPMCLGPNVLRAETAAIVGLTMLAIGQHYGWPVKPCGVPRPC